MTRQLFLYAIDSRENGDSTVLLEIATAPFWFFVAAMFAVATLTQAAMLLVGGPAPVHPGSPGIVAALPGDETARSREP
jgi:hypothetical protein